ncbi:hypothetical protein [Nocardioides fonticola]
MPQFLHHGERRLPARAVALIVGLTVLVAGSITAVVLVVVLG